MGGTFGTRTKSSVFLKKISEVHLKKVNLEVFLCKCISEKKRVRTLKMKKRDKSSKTQA